MILNLYTNREKWYCFEAEYELMWKDRNWEILTQGQFTPTHRTYSTDFWAVAHKDVGCKVASVGVQAWRSILPLLQERHKVPLRHFHPQKISLKLWRKINEVHTASMQRMSLGSGRRVIEKNPPSLWVKCDKQPTPNTIISLQILEGLAGNSLHKLIRETRQTLAIMGKRGMITVKAASLRP